MPAYFNLPDFYLNSYTYRLLFNLKQHHPEIFLPNTEIASIFGCVPNAIWNGGGMTFGQLMLYEDLCDLRTLYNEQLNIPLRWTFTNQLISHEQCYDTYCNLIMEIFHNGKNEILTSSPILESYLKHHYPHYKYCRSIIAAENKFYDPSYDLTVLKRIKNNDWQYLDSIPEQDRPKIEILCNDLCPADCFLMYQDYKNYSKVQLQFKPSSFPPCKALDKRSEFERFTARTKNTTYVTRELIDKEYLPRGFQQFKLAGRGAIGTAIGNIMEYLIKPEYWIDMVNMFIAENLHT